MDYRVICNGEVIGHSALAADDPGMGTAWGTMVPTPAYEAVRAVFRLKAEATPETSAQPWDHEKVRAYEERRARLCLSLETADEKIIATSWIEIDDYSAECSDDAIEVSAGIDEPGFFDERARRAEDYWRSRQ